ncbi:MAG: hypothetical protein RLZZ502_972 [Pseudomonadota bacterium]
MQEFIIALGIFLILEGLSPFLAPQLWKQTMQRIAQLSDEHVRKMGLIPLIGGAALLFFFGR